MKLSKWGNSLGVRLPAALVQSENLKEGDTVEVYFRDDHVLELSRDLARMKAIETIQKLARPLPPGFRFDRMEANER